MEEEKAADYYDELVRKGGNAAKFKQGLGFGTHATSVPNSDAYSSLSNFVKEASPSRAEALRKEIRIEGIRDKLKKREDNASREYYSSRTRSPEDDGHKYSHKPETEELARRKTLDDYDSENGRRVGPGRRSHSSSPGRSERGAAKKKSSVKERRGRSRSRSNGRQFSTSPSDDNGKAKWPSGTGARESRRKERNRSGRSSRSISSDSSGKSSERRKRSRRSWRDRSVSPVDERRSRRRNTSSSTRKERYSPSRSYERRRRERSRSLGRDAEYRSSHKRERARSPYESRRRRSRSPPSYRNVSNYHRDNMPTGRSDRRHVESSRRRHEDGNRDERSSGKRRDGKTEAAARSLDSRGKENPPERDYSKLIPNFDSMTPAEKVKAKMRLQLAETVVKDQAKGMSDEWERFDFDKNAPLDDDAKLDYFGDGTGATDDTLFLKNTGSSYLSSSNQVKREALVTAAHESAIFGPPEGLSLKITEPEERAVQKGHDGRRAHPSDLGPHPSEAIDKIIDNELMDPKTATPPMNSVVSEQVIAMQQAGSWQERARKMREAREAALAS